MSSTFKDLFSTQAGDYAKFRPTYPEDLFRYLASLTQEHTAVWDCGTGNGQAAVRLADYFSTVIATDPSEKQLANAARNPKVKYRVGSAEKSDIADQSVDLVTVAQAFHWFRQNEFFKEVDRVLKPKGIVVFWCYELAQISPEIDALIYRFYKGTLGSYWEKERGLVEEGYKSVELPFQEIVPPKFEMSANWNLEQLMGYLGTWSALQTYLKRNNSNPLEELYSKLKSEWGSQGALPVKWPLAIRIGRK